MDTGNCPDGCTYGWIGERCDICRLYTSRNKNMFTLSYASQSYLSHIKVTFQLPFSHLSLDWIKNMHPVFNVTFQNNFGNFYIQVGFLWKKNTLILSFSLFFKVNTVLFFTIVLYTNEQYAFFFYFKSAVMVLTSRVKVVSSVKVCVRTAHLVISQPENVMTGVVYIGLGHIVKVFGKLVLLIFAGHKLYLRTISIFKRDICASNLS